MYLLYPIINKTLVDVAKLGLAINIKQYVCPSTKLTMKIFFIQLLFFLRQLWRMYYWNTCMCLRYLRRILKHLFMGLKWIKITPFLNLLDKLNRLAERKLTPLQELVVKIDQIFWTLSLKISKVLNTKSVVANSSPF